MTEAQLQALEALQRRFIHTTSAKWDTVENKAVYNDSIVFIYDETKKGTKIYTQGATFEMSNADDVKNIINQYLPGKGEGNIVVEYVAVDATKPDGDKKLVIKEKSTGKISDLYTVAVVDGKDVATIKEEGSDSQLVQVSAVADALTTPVSTSLSVKDGVATFTESFENLKGETVTTVGSVLKAGDNVSLESDTTSPAGLKISAVDTKYTLGSTDITEGEGEAQKVTGAAINLTSTELKDGEAIVNTVNIKGGKDVEVKRDENGNIVVSSTYVAPEVEGYTLSATAGDGDTADVVISLDGTLEDEKGDKVNYGKFNIVDGGDAEVSIKDETITINSVPYVGSDAIAIAAKNAEGNKAISLKLAKDEKILSIATGENGGLKTNLFVKYDSVSNQLYLTSDNTENAYTADSQTIISSFDASAFVKDSFLKSAEFVTLTEGQVEGQAAGDYIKFTFQTIEHDGNPEEATEQVIYVPSSSLIKKGTLAYTETEGWKNTSTEGDLATVETVAAALNSLDADIDAALAEGQTKDANEILVVTGVTQVDGKITAVDSGLAATKTYVDNAITTATPTGELSLTNPENGSDYVFAVAKDAEQKEKDGFVKASDLAAILNAAWGWGEIK